jgi:hypothetical protein
MAQAVSRRPLTAEDTGSMPGSVHVGFVVDKVTLGLVLPKYFGFPLSVSFHRCSITRGGGENNTRMHNKPQGCGVSVASAAGPFTTKTKCRFNCV